MTWQEWLGSLLVLMGIGGIIIMLAEMLCGLLKLDRKRPDPEEFEEPAESDYMQNRERQLRAMAKSFGWAQSQEQRLRQAEAEAAQIAKRCEVRQ